MYTRIVAVAFCLILKNASSGGHPQMVTDKTSLLVSTTEGAVSNQIKENDVDYGDYEDINEVPAFDAVPEKVIDMYEMRIESMISNRFAHTIVKTATTNLDWRTHETTFMMILPKKAFITKFIMVIGGKSYESFVTDKEEAKSLYDKAKKEDRSAAHVVARESNRFTISANVGPKTNALFYLTYEELLERKDGHYEHVVNIHPLQLVKNLTVLVGINETKPISSLNVPSMRTGNQVQNVAPDDSGPKVDVTYIDDTACIIVFSPGVARQRHLAKSLGTDVKEGLSGQFVVQYDVERNASGGEVLLQDGYFVHFFAPPDIVPLPKHVLFILDVSGSMSGNKIEQLKAAMRKILQDLKTNDTFHLIAFENEATVIHVKDQANTIKYPVSYYGFNNNRVITDFNFPAAHSVDPHTITQAINSINNLVAWGGTNIHNALKVALHLVDREVQKKTYTMDMQPLIIFLTDGAATVGQVNNNIIIEEITELNVHNVPIFTLSLGEDADEMLLRNLSLKNNGFSRHIYEAADSSLQLQDFYKQISSPLLRNVTFHYMEDAKDVTKTSFPLHFDGKELVISGTIDKDFPKLPTVQALGSNGYIELTPEISRPVINLERVWAYMTIEQLLEEKELDKQNETVYNEKVLNLAKKFSFVTPVSSLVVVKPNGNNVVVDPKPAINDTEILDDYDDKSELKLIHEFNQLEMSLFNTTGKMVRVEPDTSDTDSAFTLKPINVNAALQLNMPWLKSYKIENNTITTYKGTYNLGLDRSTTEDTPCPSTPFGGSGFCRLLHECQNNHYLIHSVHVFHQFHCLVIGLDGVCCPKTATR